MKGPFVGADLHSGSPGAQGGSKARSGTGATRSEASMARTHPLMRLSPRRLLPAVGPNLMSSHFRFQRPLQRAGSGSGKSIEKPDQQDIRKRDHAQTLADQGMPLSATAVREVLAAEGFAP